MQLYFAAKATNIQNKTLAGMAVIRLITATEGTFATACRAGTTHRRPGQKYAIDAAAPLLPQEGSDVFSDLWVLNFIEYELSLDQEIRVIEFVLIVNHEQPGSIVRSRFGYDLAGCDGVEPVFLVIGAQVRLVEFEIDNYG